MSWDDRRPIAATHARSQEDGRESSTSLSPASKALAVADQHYEEERRARESGNTEGESEDCTDDSIGPGSRSSVRTSGQTSVVETTSEPGELEPGLDVRKGRRGFVQHRRGNGRMKGGSLLTKEEDSFGSEMESRASSSESWRYGPFVQCGGSPCEMECASILKAADPAGEVLAAADALEATSAPPARAVRMSNEEVDRLSVTGLKTMARELGIATNGFKAQLQTRIKETLATDAPGGTTTANGDLPSSSDGAAGGDKSKVAAVKAEPGSSRPGDEPDDRSRGNTAEDVQKTEPAVTAAQEAEREPGSQPGPEAPCRDDAPVIASEEDHADGEVETHVNALDVENGPPGAEPPKGETLLVVAKEEQDDCEEVPKGNGSSDAETRLADNGGEKNRENPAGETPPVVVEEHEEHHDGEGGPQVNGAPGADAGASLPEAEKEMPEEDPGREIPPVTVEPPGGEPALAIMQGDPDVDESQDSTVPHEVVHPHVPECASTSESVHQRGSAVSEVDAPQTVPDEPVRESDGDGEVVHAEAEGETGDGDDGEETPTPESSAAELESKTVVVDRGDAPQTLMPSSEEPIELRTPGSELPAVEKPASEAPSPGEKGVQNSPGVANGVVSEVSDTDEPISAAVELPAEPETVPVVEESSPADTKATAEEVDGSSTVVKEEDVEEEEGDRGGGGDGEQAEGAAEVDVDADGVTGDGSAASGVAEEHVPPCSEGEAPEACLDVSPNPLNATRSESWGAMNGNGGLPAVDEVAGEHTDQDVIEDGIETKPADAASAGAAINAPLPSPTASRVDARTVRWSVGSCVSDGSGAAGQERPKADAGGFVAGAVGGGGRGPSAAELKTKFYEAVRLWAPYLKDVGLSTPVVSGAGVVDPHCRAQANGHGTSLLPETRRFRSKARALAAWLDTVSPGQGDAGRGQGRGRGNGGSAHRSTGRMRRDEGFLGGAQANARSGSGEAKASCLPSPGVTFGRLANGGKAVGVNAPTAFSSAKISSTKILSGSSGSRPGARSMSTTRSSIGGSRRSSSTTGTRSSSVQPRRRQSSSRGSLSPSRSRPDLEVSANSRLSISSTASAAPRLGAMASTVSSRNNTRNTKRDSMLVRKTANGGKPTRGVLSASRAGSIAGSRIGSVTGSRAGSIAGSDASSVADLGSRSVAGSRSSSRATTGTGSRQVCRTGSVTSATGSSIGKASVASMGSPARMRLSKGGGRLVGGTSPPRHPRVGLGRPGVMMSPVGSSGTRVGVRAASETGAGVTRRSAGYIRKVSNGGREHGFVARNVARASRLPGVVDERGDEEPRTPQRPLRLRSKGSTASSLPARRDPLRSRPRSGTNPSLSPVLANATARVSVSPGKAITPPRAGVTRVSGTREALRVFGIEPKTPPPGGRREPGRADTCLRPVGNVSSASTVSGGAKS